MTQAFIHQTRTYNQPGVANASTRNRQLPALATIWRGQKFPKIYDIQAAVMQYYGFTIQELLSPRKAKELCRARQVAMYLAMELTPYSYPMVGRLFKRDHSTVVHARHMIRLRAADSVNHPGLQSDIDAIRKMIDERSGASPRGDGGVSA